MKKQINPTIKAHLVRSAFYVTLLLAVCVIPFALAQRNTNKRSPARPKPTANLAAAGPSAAVPSTGAALPLDKQALLEAKRAAAAARKNIGAPASLAGAQSKPDAVRHASSKVSAAGTSRPRFDLRNPPASYRPPGQPPAQATGTRFSHAPGNKAPRKVSTRPAGVCDVILNGGFETGDFTNWVTGGVNTPVVSTNQAHSGTFSAFGGDSTDGFCGFPGTENPGDSTFYQEFTVPAGGGTLSFWYWTCTTDSITFDWQDAYITDTSGTILQTIFHQCVDNEFWQQQTVDMTPFAGTTVRVEFLVHTDNFGDLTGMYVDDVSLPCAVSTPTPTPGPCGLLVGSGMTTGFLPNGWEPTLAGNTVNYTFSNSQAAPNEFALFDTHDPWGFTVIKDAITGNGHTYTEFTPADLATVDFSQYSVVILNWDDTAASDFLADYTPAIPALEAYVNAGGVVWITEAIQSCDNVPMPFGGQGTGCDFSDSDPIVDTSSPMMTGMPNPIPGSAASHLSFTGLPGGAHIVVTTTTTGNPALYDLRPGQNCGAATPTPTPTCTPGAPQWSEVAPYPFAARGPFVVSDGTFYYTGGGYDGTNVHGDLFKYDPVANTYTPLASAPDQFFLSQAVIFNNKIYSIAGFNLGGQSTTTRIYDIAGNSWTTGTPLPEPNGLSDAATGLDSGKIYIGCGFNGSGASSTLHIYDIATDTWTTGANAPTAVYLPGGGAINGKFYVVSGNNGSTEVPDVQIYDIASNTWSNGAPIPTPVTGPGSAVFGGKLYVFGGAAPFPTTITTTQIYDPATDSWSTGPSMVVARLWFYGGALDPSSILAPGGDNSPGIPINDDEILAGAGCGGTPTPTPTATPTPTCPPGGGPAVAGPWTLGNPYPSTIVRYGFAQTATHFYVFGGVDNGTRVNNVNRMDIATGVWESRAPMPFTSEAPTCALDASSGIVYCAEGDTGNHFSAYDTNADTWTPLANTPNTDDYGSASGAFNGKVFLVGGTTGFISNVWVYDIAGNTWSPGTAAPDPFLLAGYQQVGQFLYLAGGWTGGAPTGLTTTRRLDMSSAPGTWDNGPAFSMGRSDFGLAYDAGTNTLYALGGDTQGGGFFDSTGEVDELSLTGWPGGTWNPSPPDLPLPVRQANQAGFYGAGDIWSVGGIDGTTFQFLSEVDHRNNGGCPTPTPTATPTATATATATATPTATATATATPTATATVTPTAPPRPTLTPRPRPTPYPRPTPP